MGEFLVAVAQTFLVLTAISLIGAALGWLSRKWTQ